MDSQEEEEVDFNSPYLFRPFVFEEVEAEPSSSSPSFSPQLPEPRSGHRTVCDDGNFYSFGGYRKTDMEGHDQHRLFEELWCFNFAERRWKYLPTTGTAPKELASHCAFLYGNYLHIFGGTGVSFGETMSNKVTRCDLRTLKWDEVKTNGQPPDPQYGQAIVMDEGRRQLYTVGGTTGFEFNMDVHKLDLMSGNWERLYPSEGQQENEPTPRYRHEVAFDGENIYVFGGGTSNKAFTLRGVSVFNIETRTWSYIKTKRSRFLSLLESSSDGGNSGEASPQGIAYPSRRKCHTSVQIGDDVFICGGCNGPLVKNDIWKFNIPTKQWQYLPITLPVPLAFHTACLTSAGCMYTFGGVSDIENGMRTNQIFKVWLTIPKLKDICWEALLAKFDKLRKLTRDELLDIGIPRDFARRVHPSPPSGKPDHSVESMWKSDLLKPEHSNLSSHHSCVNSFV